MSETQHPRRILRSVGAVITQRQIKVVDVV